LETHYEQSMEEMAALVAYRQGDSMRDFCLLLWSQQDPLQPYN